MDVDDRDAEGGERPRRAGDGVADVVQFDVKEDRQSDLRDSGHAARPVGHEEFEAKLDPADVRPDRASQCRRSR